MKNIALVWPKSTFLDNPLTWPPLGLMYLSSRLESLKHKTEFIDLNFQDLPKDGDFDQMWLSATSPQLKEVKRIANETSNWKTKRIFGGPHAWDNPEEAKKLPFDLVVGGEADYPDNINLILEQIERPKEDNYLSLPIGPKLNWVLPPNRRWALNYHSYMFDNYDNKYRMSSLFTSRGCPMACSFCSSGREGKIWDRFVRYESIEIVEHQIKEIAEMGFTGLAYYDDILILNKKRTLQMLELHKKYQMKFRCFLRSDIICENGGKEYLQQLYDGGLIELFIGIESADNRIKNNIRKGTTIEQDTNIISWCREIGIKPKCSFIIGLPGEDLVSMNKTRDWILNQKPDGIRIQVDRLIPFSGTPLVNHPEKYDLKWETQVDEDYFYKGRNDIESHSFVSTSHLSSYEIDKFWKSLELEMTQQGYKS